MAINMKRRAFLTQSTKLAAGAVVSAVMSGRGAHGQGKTNLLELSAAAAIAAMQKGELKVEDYARALSDRARSLERLNALPPNRPSRDVYESALARRVQLREAIASYFVTQRIAALAFPPIRIPPPRIGEEGEVDIRGQKVPFYEAIARNIALGSCASMASLILPAGLTSNHLPVGIEFAALNGNDLELLSLGLSLEQALGPIPAPRI